MGLLVVPAVARPVVPPSAVLGVRAATRRVHRVTAVPVVPRVPPRRRPRPRPMPAMAVPAVVLSVVPVVPGRTAGRPWGLAAETAVRRAVPAVAVVRAPPVAGAAPAGTPQQSSEHSGVPAVRAVTRVKVMGLPEVLVGTPRHRLMAPTAAPAAPAGTRPAFRATGVTAVPRATPWQPGRAAYLAVAPVALGAALSVVSEAPGRPVETPERRAPTSRPVAPAAPAERVQQAAAAGAAAQRQAAPQRRPATPCSAVREARAAAAPPAQEEQAARAARRRLLSPTKQQQAESAAMAGPVPPLVATVVPAVRLRRRVTTRRLTAARAVTPAPLAPPAEPGGPRPPLVLALRRRLARPG